MLNTRRFAPSSSNVAALAVVLAVFASGCEAPVDDAIGSSSDDILQGSFTNARPEVGELAKEDGGEFFCTATLIGPRVVLTASHCVQYASSDSPKVYFRYAANGRVTYAKVDKVRVLGGKRDNPEKDVALLRLEKSVVGVAPAHLAAEDPASGTRVTMWGSGCQTRDSEGLESRARPVGQLSEKQKRAFVWGKKTNMGCPGDSGGPLFREDHRTIIRVTSGYLDMPYFPDRPYDVRGKTVKFNDWIQSTAREMGADVQPPLAGEASGVSPE